MKSFKERMMDWYDDIDADPDKKKVLVLLGVLLGVFILLAFVTIAIMLKGTTTQTEVRAAEIVSGDEIGDERNDAGGLIADIDWDNIIGYDRDGNPVYGTKGLDASVGGYDMCGAPILKDEMVVIGTAEDGLPIYDYSAIDKARIRGLTSGTNSDIDWNTIVGYDRDGNPIFGTFGADPNILGYDMAGNPIYKGSVRVSGRTDSGLPIYDYSTIETIRQQGRQQQEDLKKGIRRTTNEYTSGKRGKGGIDGDDGSDGNNKYGRGGATGGNGDNGNRGKSGKSGKHGNDGTSGGDGSSQSGKSGRGGRTGENGSRGASGKQGAQGDSGKTVVGVRGVKGPKGDTGNTGASGNKGSKGQSGGTGATGRTGQQGNPGKDGSDGSTGARGFDGADGSKGQKGSTGSRGERGVPGVKGEQGTQGANRFQHVRYAIGSPKGKLEGEVKLYTEAEMLSITGQNNTSGDYNGANPVYEWWVGVYTDSNKDIVSNDPLDYEWTMLTDMTIHPTNENSIDKLILTEVYD